MKLRPGDVLAYQGQDYAVEGVVTYQLGGKAYPLARAVVGGAGGAVHWIEPLMDAMDDRVLIFAEDRAAKFATPPPKTLSYKGKSFVPKLDGKGRATIVGTVPDRRAGESDVELWRYRAAGDVFVQIEKWPDRVVVLVGESVHKDMIDVRSA